MKKQLLQLYKIFIKYELFILKYTIVLPLRFGFFCTTTKPGTLFLYLLVFGVFFLPYSMAIICMVILTDILIVGLMCTILAQFKQTRKILIEIIGKENFSKYVGDK